MADASPESGPSTVAANRLHTTLHHLAPARGPPPPPAAASTSSPASSTSAAPSPAPCAAERPYPRGVAYGTQKPLKWNGWGYEGTSFAVNEEGQVYLTGNEYELSGKVFPNFRPWLEDNVEGMDIDYTNPPQHSISLPPAVQNNEFVQAVEGHAARTSLDRMDCLMHAHGHTAQDIHRLRYGTFDRIPDFVVWPGSHEDVEFIVKLAHEMNVVVIPYGGGTTVTESLECSPEETRFIVSLDTKMMNAIKWVDRESMMACIEAGATGKDLDARLAMMGLTLGHEPDSMEFSSLGGWIATRASGMKKNRYGNIDDMLVHVKMVSPLGTVERNCHVPRISCGPDVHQMILGSEGIFGVITEATMKVRHLPQCRDYGSIAFPDFESGVGFMHEVAMKKAAPASVRMMDNMQFQLGHCLAPEDNSKLAFFTNALKKVYLTKWAGFDLEKMCAATLLFEGTKEEVALQQKNIYAIAAKHKGIKAGSENGRKGYFMTYMIAYLRDYGYTYWLMAESFETSVPWSNVLTLCEKVKERIYTSCKEKGLPFQPLASCRVTQTYDTGACVYFYFAYVYRGVEEPLERFAEVEGEARDEVLKWGGSISHHHGVGQLRKQWVTETVSPVGVEMLRALKKKLDPKNIMGTCNIIDI
eukprot:TRINITY_DN3667_c1_g1_i1.p1 TRINITY_DN3667_c1_g1~~TRINITY_DN3667_c1_g1_i1.p1  ORF type:complete len:657 (+),score=226.26 TRINITY_DN3667_c1_g1_i1:47-1972(+)